MNFGPEPEHVWTKQTARIRNALEALGRGIKGQYPAVRWTINHSSNDVKPLDMIFVATKSGNWAESIVLSVMYTRFRGPLVRHCDLVIEDGDLLDALPDDDLGEKATWRGIDKSVSEVIDFVERSKATILTTLAAW